MGWDGTERWLLAPSLPGARPGAPQVMGMSGMLRVMLHLSRLTPLATLVFHCSTHN